MTLHVTAGDTAVCTGAFIIKTQSASDSKGLRSFFSPYFHVRWRHSIVDHTVANTVMEWLDRVLVRVGDVAWQHIRTHPCSYLTRFLGVHRISFRRHGLRKDIHFTVMKNIFFTPLHIDCKFDLKVSGAGVLPELALWPLLSVRRVAVSVGSGVILVTGCMSREYVCSFTTSPPPPPPAQFFAFLSFPSRLVRAPPWADGPTPTRLAC